MGKEQVQRVQQSNATATKSAAQDTQASKKQALLAGVEGFDAGEQAMAPKQEGLLDAGNAAGPTTLGGTWSLVEKAPVLDQTSLGPKVGGLMRLEFAPTSPVVGKKISLIQTVKSTVTEGDGKEQNNAGNDPDRLARSTADGTNIDRAPGQGSPNFTDPASELRAAQKDVIQDSHAKKTAAWQDAQGDDTKLGDLEDLQKAQVSRVDGDPKAPALNQPGSRTAEGAVTPAKLRDRVATLWKKNSVTKWRFETAAVVEDGDMAGVFLGSVNWSLESKKSETAPTSPDTFISEVTPAREGAPSAGFMDAGKKWNGQADYSVPYVYNVAKAAGKRYSGTPTQAEVNEVGEFIRPSAVADADLIDGKPDPKKWAPYDIAVKVKAMPLVDSAAYDTYLPEVVAAGGDAAKLKLVQAKFDKAMIEKKMAEDAAKNTWKNLVFAGQAKGGSKT